MLTRWAETRDYGRRLTNAEPWPCEACGLELAPGRARVWRCSGLDCEAEEHRLPARRGDPARGLHVTCLDAEACRERRRPPAHGVHELAASAREAWRELMVREARERVQARLAEQRERPAATMRPPRYDEVWERGVAWLESLPHGEGQAAIIIPSDRPADAPSVPLPRAQSPGDDAPATSAPPEASGAQEREEGPRCETCGWLEDEGRRVTELEAQLRTEREQAQEQIAALTLEVARLQTDASAVHASAVQARRLLGEVEERAANAALPWRRGQGLDSTKMEVSRG